MFIRRICAATIVGLAMWAGVASTSQAASDWWYPNGAYETGKSSNRTFKRGNVTCDRVRDICYDRYGISYQATKRYLGEKEANRAYKKYGKQVHLFSPKPGVVCDRRTETCTSKRWAGNSNGWMGNSNGGNWSHSNQSRDGFGAVGSGRDYQPQQSPYYWRDND